MAVNILQALMRDENSITRTLVSLCQLRPVRDVVVRFLTSGEHSADDVDYVDISDQVTLKCGRPDIEFRSERVHVLVEVKTSSWTVLQDSQPDSYLDWLSTSEDIAPARFLILLAPPKYGHLEEYQRRLTDCTAKRSGGNLKTATLNWLGLVQAFEEAGLDDAIPYVRDFCEALKVQYVPSPIAFLNSELLETDMFTRQSAEAHVKVFSLIEALASELVQSGFTILGRKSKQWWNGEHGFYFARDSANNSEPVLWLGLWAEYWREHGEPIVVGVDRDWKRKDAIKHFKSCFPNAADFHGYDVVPIPRTAVMQDAIADVMQWLRPYVNGIGQRVPTSEGTTKDFA